MRYLIVSSVNELNFLNLKQLIHDVRMDVLHTSWSSILIIIESKQTKVDKSITTLILCLYAICCEEYCFTISSDQGNAGGE